MAGKLTEEPARVLHCWADGPAREVSDLPLDHPRWWGGLRSIGSTCMLLDGHEGEHEWTPDDEIGVEFLPAGEELSERGKAMEG